MKRFRRPSLPNFRDAIPNRDVLSDELVEKLGPEDESNRWIVPPRKQRKRSSVHEKRKLCDRKLEQVLRKKEKEIEERNAFEILQKFDWSSETFSRCQQLCSKSKSKRRSSTPESSETQSEASPSRSPPKPDQILIDSFLIVDPPSEIIDPPSSAIDQKETSSDGDLDEEEMLIAFEGLHRVVFVNRTEIVEAFRSKLPIIGYEQEIMELIGRHDIVVICGETGCGKTTQVPQFLYEAGYGCPTFEERNGRIGVTQPRRIAATSTATRVAHELNTKLGNRVGFQIRHDLHLSSSTAIKFMTDGILVVEIQKDFLLRQYDVLIVDEVHERSLNTDLILGMLSRIVRLRRKLKNVHPLKVVVMSATLETKELISNRKLFVKPPPILHVPSRQFSVTVHFSKKTEMDYEAEAMKKICRIHRRLPPGGILVFLTGKREIDRFCSKLTQRLHRKTLPKGIDEEERSDEELETLPGTIEGNPPIENDIMPFMKAKILPLYAMLPPREQSRVFEAVPEGMRLIVVATNVAETSITIPGVRYVVDCGRAKKKVLHAETDVSHFRVDWISKASAIQRAGRAGRTLPGHCYRLYSSAHFGQNFPEYEAPEIQCVCLEEVVLLMKSMEIQKLQNFPFPSQPDPIALSKAEDTLIAIEALDSKDRRITALGKQMMSFPIGPRHARLILEAREIEENEKIEGLTLFSLALAATMSLESPFLPEADKKRRKTAHRPLQCTSSDPITSLLALCIFQRHPNPNQFCEEHLLHQKIMKEAANLEKQLRLVLVQTLAIDGEEILRMRLPEPSAQIVNLLRKCIVAGWRDRISVRYPGEGQGRFAYYSLHDPERTQEPFYIHPLSALSKTSPKYVIYLNAMKTTKRIYMNRITKVEPEWIFP